MESRSQRAFPLFDGSARMSNGILRTEREDDIIHQQSTRSYNPFNQSTLIQTVEIEDADSVQPLRTMAERIGKEVEKFAEKVDQWMSHGNDRLRQDRSPTELFSRFKEEAQSMAKPLRTRHVKDLGRRQASQSQEALSKLRHNLFDGSVIGDNEVHLQESEPITKLKRWQTEVDTWDLAHLLFAERYAKDEDKVGRLGTPPVHEGLWDAFILHDDSVKEQNLVLSWLKQTADTRSLSLDALSEQFEKGGYQDHQGSGTWTQGWQATKERIKGEKRLGFWGPASEAQQPRLQNSTRTDLLVTHLDPDATSRQSRALEDTDELQERFLWYMIYQCQRRGISNDEAREWLAERNESWRSVSLGFAASSRSAQAELLWRRMCYANSATTMRAYEAAAYGVLGGDLLSITRITSGWEDLLFAHFNTLVLSRFDKYLQAKLPSSVLALSKRLPAFDTTRMYDVEGDLRNASSTIVDMVAKIKDVNPTAVQKIQGSLISGRFTSLLASVGAAIALIANADSGSSSLIPPPTITTRNGYEEFAEDEHILRLIVHLYISLNESGAIEAASKEQQILIENVMVWYIDMLRVARKLDLLPLYAAQLSKDRLAMTLGLILADIRNDDEQKRTIRLMQRCNINVEDVLNAQFSAALNACNFSEDINDDKKPLAILRNSKERHWPGHAIKPGFISHQIEPTEQAVIDALHWFLHLKAWKFTIDAIAEALIMFLRDGRLSAAVALTKELDIGEISHEKTPHYLGGESINIVEWSEDGPIQPVRKSRRTRSGTQKPSHSRQSSVQSEPFDETVAIKRTLRKQAKICIELQQMVSTLNDVNDWAEVVEAIKASDTKPTKKELSDARRLFEKICSQVDAILSPGFLDYSPDVYELLRDPLGDDGSDINTIGSLQTTAIGTRIAHLDAIRPAYIPEVTLGYLAAVYSAANVTSKEYLLHGMELAALVADDEHADLAALFVQTKRMGELVDVLAKVSLGMVEADEAERNAEKEDDGTRTKGKVGNKSRQERRDWEGEVLGLWDVTVKN